MGSAQASRPTLLQRLGLRRLPAGHGVPEGRLLLLRVSIWLTLVGPTISLLALALPGPSGRDAVGAVATGVVGYAIAVVLLAAFERTPFWAFPAFSAVGTGVTTYVLVSTGESASATALFYVWIALAAGYFFPPLVAAAQFALIALGYGVVLALTDQPGPDVAQGVVLVATVVGAGALVAALRRRLLRLLRLERQEVERLREVDRLREELRQSQKLEALGRLAGGIAHDFNNILTGIMGYGELALLRLGEEDGARRDVEEMQRAAERAAGLTRQLLVFSRKQVLSPAVVDVVAVVRESESMLGRIIGEDVRLEVDAPDGALPVRADAAQLQQVVLNLAVNARDAMPDGGRLVIQTALAEPRSADDPELPGGGPCALLAVTDSGCGMDEETLGRAFDPFFTTKDDGTGLGLATVYGIVSQAGGRVSIASRPGRGTTVTALLPLVGAAPAPSGEEAAAAPGGGDATILLVDDEDVVRDVARRVLVASGYTVLEARFGAEAIVAAEEHDGPIDLLLTDVVMPHMSGRELAERLVADRPELVVVYMSGHADDAVLRHGVLAGGSPFVQKPFTAGRLLRDVADALRASSVA
ncbi:MAG: response regulator [Thermoleophilia bacterium]